MACQPMTDANVGMTGHATCAYERRRVEIMVTVDALWTTDVISKPSSERVCVHDHVAGAGMHRALPSMDGLVILGRFSGTLTPPFGSACTASRMPG